jgi:hypothetical protein
MCSCATVRIPYFQKLLVLAKITSKNQLTLPKAAVEAIGTAEYFDVEVREGQIVLTPVRIQRGDVIRAKFAALGLGSADITDAVRWTRAEAAPVAAEPPANYAPKRRTPKPKAKKKSPRGA